MSLLLIFIRSLTFTKCGEVNIHVATLFFLNSSFKKKEHDVFPLVPTMETDLSWRIFN